MICLVPLGGYVKFVTENDEPEISSSHSDRLNLEDKEPTFNRSFESASLIRRSLTVLAGPGANFLMAIVIFSFVSTMTGVMSTEPVIGNVAKIPSQDFSLMVGDRILTVEEQPVQTFSQIYEIIANLERLSDVNLKLVRDGKTLNETIPHLFQPIVFHVEMFSPAMKSGVKSGDVFLEANKQLIFSFEELKSVINSSNGRAVSVKIWRNGEIISIDLIPEMRPTETSDGNLVEEMRIGVRGGTLFSPELVRPNLLESAQMGVRMTSYVVKTSLLGLFRMIDNTISPKHLSGPIGVAKALSHSASEGVMPFLSLLAAISAGIGLINLFPIPILDGGHLMLFLYEGVFKKPPSKQVSKFFIAVGLTILLALMVFATFNDIVR
jgi:regulator of sigma E protease